LLPVLFGFDDHGDLGTDRRAMVNQGVPSAGAYPMVSIGVSLSRQAPSRPALWSFLI
jgi:hypothetical protein